MLKTTFLSLFFIAMANMLNAQVNVDITKPGINYQKHSDSSGLVVRGIVTSPYEITYFSVTINNSPIAITLQPDGSFVKKIALESFPEDTLTLKVQAINTLGQSASDSVFFIHDNKPVLTILEPSVDFVATPLMHIKLLCKDVDTCDLKISVNNTVIYTNRVKDSFETNISYQSFAQNPPATITQFSVTDRYGNTQSAEVRTMVITPQNSPNLILTYKGAKPILDFKDSLIFVTNIDTLRKGYSPSIINIKNNKEEVIPAASYKVINIGILTPRGAVFGNKPYSPYNTSSLEPFYDWNNKTLTTLFTKSQKNIGNIMVSGKWAAWYVDAVPVDSFYLKDLTANTTVSFTMTPYNYNLLDSACDLAENGTIVYNRNSISNLNVNQLSTYKNGSLTNIGRPFIGNYMNVFPLTDGKNIVYRRLGNGWKNADSILLYDGTTTIFLAAYTTEDDNAPYIKNANYYAVNNRYVAFLTEDISKNFQVNLRNPSGVTKKLSQFGFPGARTTIKTLTPTGDVMVAYGSDLYLIPLNDTIRRIYNDIGKVYYTNAKWYIVIGNAIFEINPAVTGKVLTAKQDISVTESKLNIYEDVRIKLFPNPAYETLYLYFTTKQSTNIEIVIFGNDGKKLQSKKVQLPYGASIQTLNVEALNKGTYFVQCTTKDENIGIKFVKQ